MHKCMFYNCYITNRWEESHKTAVIFIKARFLTLIVGNQAKRVAITFPLQ